MKKLEVRRNVEGPNFPGLVLDSITSMGYTFYSAQEETGKLLAKYGYEMTDKNDDFETWERG